jgi:glutamine synthetase adenylyltransferase
MNDIFKKFLNNFMIIDIHDNMIFSKNLKEHEQHVRLVFNKLWGKKFEVKLKKSYFFINQRLGS